MSQRASVLLLDSSPAMGDAVRETLEPLGHVVLVHEPQLALNLSPIDAFDVVLLHGALPLLSVRELVRTCRLRRAEARIIVIGPSPAQIELYLGADLLPWPTTAEELQQAVRIDPPSGRIFLDAPRILLVDDDLMVLESVRDVLDQHHSVTATTSPLEALRLLHERPYHMMLTDLLMYEMDGMELIRSARTIQPMLRALVMTGYGTKETAIAAVKEGAYDFLEKPLTPAILLQAVDRAWSSLRTELENQKRLQELEHTNRQLMQEMEQRRRVERELVQAQKLEAVGQMAAGIAHEINTPLQFIGDNSRFLQESLPPLIKLIDEWSHLEQAPQEVEPARQLRARLEQQLGFLDDVPQALADNIEGVRRLDRIVQAMREYAHPGTGEKSELDFNRALTTMATVSRGEWKYVAELQLDLQPDLPLVPAVPEEINQAILNLIVNAGHAIRQRLGDKAGKGTITIRTRRNGSTVQLDVIDDGCGIPPAIQHRVFDPFFTTKPVGQGTGQGLAITHAVVVKKHGGQLLFESEEGKGTTFTMILPLGD